MGTGSTTPKLTNSGGSKSIPNNSEAVAQSVAAVPLATVSLKPVAIDLPAIPTLASKDVASPSVATSNVASSDSSPLAQIVPFAHPFVGFIGHSFLHFCQFVDFVSRSIRPQHPTEIAAESLLNSSTQHSTLKYWGSCSLGMICCTVTAAGLIPLFSTSSIKSFLPLLFLSIVVGVAYKFGRAAGVLGTVAAAWLFAWFLFEPAGLSVGDPVAKSHLIWMLIIGIVVSDLLARFRMRHTGRNT